jgi:hypothetical protein
VCRKSGDIISAGEFWVILESFSSEIEQEKVRHSEVNGGKRFSILPISYAVVLKHGIPGFEPGSGRVGFVVDKVALGQVFSEYFGFPCQSSFR